MQDIDTWTQVDFVELIFVSRHQNAVKMFFCRQGVCKRKMARSTMCFPAIAASWHPSLSLTGVYSLGFPPVKEICQCVASEVVSGVGEWIKMLKTPVLFYLLRSELILFVYIYVYLYRYSHFRQP